MHCLNHSLPLFCLTTCTPVYSAELFIDSMFGVEIQEDLVFGMGSIGNPASGEIPLALDLFSPVDAEFKKPAMLLLYGGGFENRELDQLRPLAEEFASRGWVTATVDYRTIPDNPTAESGPFGEPADALARAMHAAFNDAAKGLAWMKENAERIGIDPERIVIGGASSGAITTLFEGYRSNSAAAVVSLCGGMYGFESLIDAGDSPVVLVHNEIDELVSFSLAQDVVTRAEEVGVPNSLLTFEDAGHCSFVFDPNQRREAIDFVNGFLYEQLELTAIAKPNLTGDFNGNGVLDSGDINELTKQSASSNDNSYFDLNGDSLLNRLDVAFWVKDLRNTWIGDANLDGVFNSEDMVSVVMAGKYERDSDANWTEGDWTGDYRFGSADLVAAFTDGGYERELRAGTNGVPEPTGLLMLTAGLITATFPRRRAAP